MMYVRLLDHFLACVEKELKNIFMRADQGCKNISAKCMLRYFQLSENNSMLAQQYITPNAQELQNCFISVLNHSTLELM